GAVPGAWASNCVLGDVRGPRSGAERVPSLRAGAEARGQPRFVTAGCVPVNDPFARHLVDQRDGLFQRRFRGARILAVDGGADALQRPAQARSELAVVLAVL